MTNPILALCTFRRIGRDAEMSEFELHIRLGCNFYRKHFFRDDGASKYFHNLTCRIDIHNVAQSIITLAELSNFDKSAMDVAIRVYRWAIKNMRSKNGYFFYQQKKFFKNKISYMRWSQAWMLYALAIFAQALRNMNDSSYLSKK